MIDLHCHILPGIDDGARNWDEAVDMARSAQADGIRALAATPHVYDATFAPAQIEELVRELTRRLKALHCPLRILPGAELHWDVALDLAERYQIGCSGVILLEFPHSHLPGDALYVVRKLVERGIRPLVAHPERNAILPAPERLRVYSSRGILPVTADSLTGPWGGLRRMPLGSMGPGLGYLAWVPIALSVVFGPPEF